MSMVTETSSAFSAEPIDNFYSDIWYHEDDDCDRGPSCRYGTYSDSRGKTFNFSVLSSAESLPSIFWQNDKPHRKLNTAVAILIATAAMIRVIRSFRRSRLARGLAEPQSLPCSSASPTSLDSASEGQLPQDLIRPRPRFLYRVALNSILRFLGILSKCGYFCGVAMLAVVVVLEMSTDFTQDPKLLVSAEAECFGFGFAMSVFEALLEEYIFGRYGVI
ncbi:uncharacterized protein V2V93DRAFT_367198 [Kockiozyma suomiensis]|uniref:uncharacterized protein n=1 Tax=Kockiozyma suomiensis TaxID=1337062 RepID=UPI003343B152